ncbi:hypothetical protein CEXT_210891 [Caerostris extrusa]|uniref:Uncharacterized protein n=1 Tax=Caerostris extrusa TaxID=172846 RepID=A0AAV4Y6V7_CAEEX|nr:hypothetical protein CEXT_210891 [Caerostris extrusa]
MIAINQENRRDREIPSPVESIPTQEESWPFHRRRKKKKKKKKRKNACLHVKGQDDISIFPIFSGRVGVVFLAQLHFCRGMGGWTCYPQLSDIKNGKNKEL